jgi:hypothetical protein
MLLPTVTFAGFGATVIVETAFGDVESLHPASATRIAAPTAEKDWRVFTVRMMPGYLVSAQPNAADAAAR